MSLINVIFFVCTTFRVYLGLDNRQLNFTTRKQVLKSDSSKYRRLNVKGTYSDQWAIPENIHTIPSWNS